MIVWGSIFPVCSDESRGNVRKVSSATVRFDTSNNNSTTVGAAAQEGTYVRTCAVRTSTMLLLNVSGFSRRFTESVYCLNMFLTLTIFPSCMVCGDLNERKYTAALSENLNVLIRDTKAAVVWNIQESILFAVQSPNMKYCAPKIYFKAARVVIILI